MKGSKLNVLIKQTKYRIDALKQKKIQTMSTFKWLSIYIIYSYVIFNIKYLLN